MLTSSSRSRLRPLKGSQALPRQPVASATRKIRQLLCTAGALFPLKGLCAPPPRGCPHAWKGETRRVGRGSPSSAATHISPATGRFQQRSLRAELRCTPPAVTSPTATLGAPPCPSPSVQGPPAPSWPGAPIPPCHPGPLSSLPSRGPSPSLPSQHPPGPSPCHRGGPLSPRLPRLSSSQDHCREGCVGGFWARAHSPASAPAPEAQDADLMSPFLSSLRAPFSRERSPYRTWACRVTPGGLHLLPVSGRPAPPISFAFLWKTNQVASERYLQLGVFCRLPTSPIAPRAGHAMLTPSTSRGQPSKQQ